MEIIGHGADPAAADDLGRTPVMIADSVGNLAVATFLRSFIARREMDALFDSGVLDEVDPPASKYPRMTP